MRDKLPPRHKRCGISDLISTVNLLNSSLSRGQVLLKRVDLSEQTAALMTKAFKVYLFERLFELHDKDERLARSARATLLSKKRYAAQRWRMKHAGHCTPNGWKRVVAVASYDALCADETSLSRFMVGTAQALIVRKLDKDHPPRLIEVRRLMRTDSFGVWHEFAVALSHVKRVIDARIPPVSKPCTKRAT